MNAKITGIGHYLPHDILTNDELSSQLDTNDEWIRSRTGIRQRHIAAPNELTSDLATAALRSALTDGGLLTAQLDGIIVATTTPDLLMPSTAVKVQQNIGMKHGFAFDIQAACAGFLYALGIGYSMIVAGQATKLAIIGAETMSRIVDWEDRRTCILFGDGSGAIILEKANECNSGIIAIDLYSDGRFLDILKVKGGVSAGALESKLEMNGQEVYKFAIENMYTSISKILQKTGLSVDNLNWIISHQANYRIISSLIDKLSIPMGKVLVTVDRHANTSAASIPLVLSIYKEKCQVKKGDLIMLTAVGAGMTWGSAVLRL